jgi:hypothetical protein
LCNVIASTSRMLRWRLPAFQDAGAVLFYLL